MKRATIRKRPLKKGVDGKPTKFSYLVTIELGRNPITGKRERLCKSAPTLKEANSLAKQLEDGISEDKKKVEEQTNNVEKQKITVEEQLKRFLNAKRGEVRIRTWERYEAIVVQHLIPALGNVILQELTPSMIQDYISSALGEGRIDGVGGLSGTTVRQHRMVLIGALDLAFKNQIIDFNAARSVSPPRKGSFDIPILSAKELNILLNYFSLRVTQISIAVYLAVVTGMRLSETLAVRWKDIDFTNKKLSVCRGLHVDKSGKFHFYEPKSKESKRSISLTDKDILVLKNHFEKQQKEKEALAGRYNDQGLVCAKADGSPLSPSNVSSNFSRTAKSLGLKISFHGLRHTHATILLAMGVPPKYVAARLGHAKTSTTEELYAQIIPNIDQKAADTFAEIIQTAAA